MSQICKTSCWCWATAVKSWGLPRSRAPYFSFLYSLSAFHALQLWIKQTWHVADNKEEAKSPGQNHLVPSLVFTWSIQAHNSCRTSDFPGNQMTGRISLDFRFLPMEHRLRVLPWKKNKEWISLFILKNIPWDFACELWLDRLLEWRTDRQVACTMGMVGGNFMALDSKSLASLGVCSSCPLPHSCPQLFFLHYKSWATLDWLLSTDRCVCALGRHATVMSLGNYSLMI